VSVLPKWKIMEEAGASLSTN